jgi:hypothetical protein
MHQPTRHSYLDSIAFVIRGDNALAAARGLRRLYRKLTGRHTAHPHHVHQLRLARLPRFDPNTWSPGMPLCLRLSLGWLGPVARAEFCEWLGLLGVRIRRVDGASDFPLGTTLEDVVLVDRPDAQWHRPRGYRTRYVGHLATDDVSFAAYADKPSKLAPAGPYVLHVEARLHGRAVPRDVRRDPLALLDLDHSRFAASFIRARRKRTFSAVDRVDATMRWLASDSGRFTTSDAKLAELSSTPKTTVRRRISALAGSGRLEVLRRAQGRGHRSRYRLTA